MAKTSTKILIAVLVIIVLAVVLFFVLRPSNKPDLIISNVTFGFAQSPVYITISNIGNSDVTERVTLCVWDKDSTKEAYKQRTGTECSMSVTNYDPSDASKNLAIKAGQSINLTFSSLGGYFPPLNFEIDSDNVVKESNEDNNFYTLTQ